MMGGVLRSDDQRVRGRLPIDDLRHRVARALAESRVLGGPPSSVEHVPNWGNFVHASFRVRCGGRDVVAKLAWERDAISGLARWRALAPLLHERHRAPAMLGWLALAGTEYEGPLLEWIEGASPTARDDALVRSTGALLDGLHADADLASRLRAPVGIATCRDVFLGTFDERFRADLVIVEASPPPFVSARDLRWMREETERLADAARRSEAFSDPADVPCHGDLWVENLIVGPGGALAVLDWDGLALGDPALDWAAFLGPTRDHPVVARFADVPDATRRAPRWRARFAHHARAGLFDAALDGLADWVDADALGAGAAAMRVRKRASVESALAAYRATYA